jgi:hypothetical protein
MAFTRYHPTSTAIAFIDYDPDTEECRVTFTDDHVYAIESLPVEVVTAWIAARSQGQYWNYNIRGKY